MWNRGSALDAELLRGLGNRSPFSLQGDGFTLGETSWEHLRLLPTPTKYSAPKGAVSQRSVLLSTFPVWDSWFRDFVWGQGGEAGHKTAPDLFLRELTSLARELEKLKPKGALKNGGDGDCGGRKLGDFVNGRDAVFPRILSWRWGEMKQVDEYGATSKVFNEKWKEKGSC